MRKSLTRTQLILYSPDLILILCLIMGLTSCQKQSSSTKDSVLRVIATTSLVGDIVSQVGGDKIALDVLLPLGTDPHSFSPTPRDASKIADATIVFANGVGLEEFLEPLVENIGTSIEVVELSQGIIYRNLVEEDSNSMQPVDDPHTWFDPNNVIVWVDNIIQSLSDIDPNNADYYIENGHKYQEKLSEVDGWIRSQVALIPEYNRKLVTDHQVFGYFSDRYNFTQVGTIIPGFSSLAEPSAQDIAQIEDEIQSLGVKAIFISFGVNANLAQRIADDTGTQLVYLYMHSLSDKGGEADTYLSFMRYDVTSILIALK